MPGAPASRLAQLHRFGQSPWLDHLDRELVARGGLKRLVDRDGLGGVTTDPAAIARAVAAGKAYDEQIRELAHEGLGAAGILDRLAVDDARAACDVLAPVYMGSGGEDGFVSIEVTPGFAADADSTVEEAQRLFTAVDRPNVMIRIPATAEGVQAAQQAMREGLNVDVALLFTVGHFEAVAGVYLDALEYRLRRDLTIRALSSVAGMPVARVDAAVDAVLADRAEEAASEEERRRLAALKGRAGVAAAKVLFERFRNHLRGRDWQLIAASGAKVQRLLWAGGVADPAQPELLYADELIGQHTVIALPDGAWRAYNDRGTPARTADRHLEEAHRILRELGRLGIDVDRLGAQLQAQGLELARDEWEGAVAAVEQRRAALLGEEVAT